MNAAAKRLASLQQVSGDLLHAGYQYSDGLMLDLYGTLPTADDGHEVTSIAVSGTTVCIAELFRGRQMQNMGLWLDFKDGSPVHRAWAERYKHHAAAYRD